MTFGLFLSESAGSGSLHPLVRRLEVHLPPLTAIRIAIRIMLNTKPAFVMRLTWFLHDNRNHFAHHSDSIYYTCILSIPNLPSGYPLL